MIFPLRSLFLCCLLLASLPAAQHDLRLGAVDEDGYCALVYLPDSYDVGAERYGLLFLLHGAGGNEATWGELADLPALANEYQRIVVVPSCGAFSWYVDRFVDGDKVHKAETHLTDALLPRLDRELRTKPGDRWITGFSMGGYGALRLGFRRPDLFSAVGGLSPCIVPSRWDTQWKLDAAMGPSVERQQYDLTMTDEWGAEWHRPLSLLCGGQDFFYNECIAAHRRLDKLGIAHQWLDVQGGHDRRFWTAYLPRQLAWFASQTQAPAAEAEVTTEAQDTASAQP